MKIIAISDTHNKHQQIRLPEGDVIVHAGDATMMGRIDEVIDFVSWYGSLEQYEAKIFVAGNHDFLFEKNRSLCKTLCEENGITWLQGSSIEIDNIHFHGNSNQPTFFDWAFNYPRNGKVLRESWENIPEETDVLITHSPTYGFLDVCLDYRDHKTLVNVGCEALRAEIDKPNRLKNLKVCVSGHIHHSYGETSYLKKISDESYQNIKFIDASICNERYEAVNPPIMFEV